jgi:hypothetical protein
MKILILTGYDRNMAALAELCMPSKRAWAARQGVPLHVLRDADFPAEHGHPSFQKLRHIRWHLDRHDAVVWMDADSVITNPEPDPRDMAQTVIECGAWPWAVSRDYKAEDEDPRPWWNQWSAGHAIWFNDPRAFALLDEAMKRTEFAWSGLWDQDALQACIGDSAHPARPQIWDTRSLNSVLPGLTGRDDADWRPGDFLCHFTGIAYEDRVRVARDFIEARKNEALNGAEPHSV